MSLKIIIESEVEEKSEDSVECPKCGCECEAEDKFCCDCGTKLPAPKGAMAGARMSAMQKMMGEEED